MVSPQSSVLILEDSDEDFDTCVEAARAVGLQTQLRRARTGEECIDLLCGKERQGTAGPALLLLDLNAPGVDGRDALVVVRQTPWLKVLPIVILSTSDDPRDVAHCYAHGANAYHVKPVHHVRHLDVVREVLRYWLSLAVLPARTVAP